MADSKIIVVGPSEVELITDLYNQVFSPGVDADFFRRRFEGRHNETMIVAMIEGMHVGFIIGFELMPSTYFSWLCGVLPDFRRQRVAIQLMQAQSAWAKDHDYAILRFECRNQHRPMLHVAITEGFDLVGMRYDTFTASNVVIFEKELH